MDYEKAIRISENSYWVGMYLENDPFQCHPYFIENGDESILIDPGSMLEFKSVVEKLKQLTDLKNIKYIILHHQDPDLVAAVPEIEKLIDRDDLQIVTHSRMTVLIKHYLVTSSYYEIDKHDLKLKTKNGLELQFLTTPYCHSPGAFVTYEPKNKILFSGDIFGGLEESWEFFAKEDYFEQAKQFHREYMPSKDIFNYALNKIEKLDLELIAPQHGSIIQKQYIKKLIDDMKQLECGLYIDKKYNEELHDTIVKLKRKEAELNEEKLNAELILETNQNAIISINSKMEVSAFNKSAESIFGYTKEEMLGWHSLPKIIPSDLLSKHNKGLEHFMKTGASKGLLYNTVELTGLRKNGERFPLRISFGANSDPKHRIVVANMQDISNEKRKEQLFQQQSRLAQMGEMISMIAHQWRQPLAAISATSAFIELKMRSNKLDNDALREKAHNISKFSQHLSATIDDFRNFFKPNKEKKETTYDDLIASVLGIIEVSISNKHIQLVQELNCHETFSTYSNELRQVILNLIKNAEDALLEKAVEDPTIKIATYTKEDKYILEISDNGGGIPEDIIEKIFDPYYSTKMKKDGTGLGLYMSKTIIEEHCGGKLDVANGNDGAVFRICLKGSA